MNNSATRLCSVRRNGFTLSELLAVMAILLSLAALLFPAFGSAKATAKGAVCLSNLHQIGLATNLYMGDNDDSYPRIVNAFERIDPLGSLGRGKGDNPKDFPSLTEALLPYTKSRAVFICPVDGGAYVFGQQFDPTFAEFNGGSSYVAAELFNGQSGSTWKDPASDTWACDAGPSWHSPAFDAGELETYKVNAVFYDWHVALRLGNAPTFLE